MIRVSGVGLVPAPADPFPQATVFLGSRSLLGALGRGDLRDRIQAALAGSRGVVWVAPGRITVLRHDADGRVLSPFSTLAGGPRLEAGARVAADGPDRLTLDGAAGRITLALEGERAGALAYEATLDGQAWMRYAFPALHLRPAFEGVSYRLFEPTPVRVSARFDPSRPFEPAVTRLTPTAPTPQRSTFRTRLGQVITLTARPPDSAYVPAFDPVRDEGYLTLDGPWDWTADDATPDLELLLAWSGIEYARASGASTVRFVAGAPALAPGFQGTASGVFPLADTAPGVPWPVQTAWLYPRSEPPAAAGDFSQPAEAGLFSQAGDSFLETLALQAAALPPGASTPHAPAASFPAVPYAGADPAVPLELARRFENRVLSSARTQVIYGLKPAGPVGLTNTYAPLVSSWPASPISPTGPTGPARLAVTPQGLLSIFREDLSRWDEVALARTQLGTQRLSYTDIDGTLREALLANQLFLVVSDVAKLYQHCSTRFEVTPRVIERLRRASPVPAPEPVIQGAIRLLGSVYHSRPYFAAALDSVIDGYPTWKDFIALESELAELEIAGWRFDLASRAWRDPDRPTILVIKFADADVESLVGDLSRWTLPDVFNEGDGSAAQGRLRAIIEDARRRVDTDPDLRYFVETVLAGRQGGGADVWNGVLYLNAAVPAGAFPPELAALQAGLGGPLRAHHLGVTLSSFEVDGGTIVVSDSSLFGLIVHDDPGDLVYTGSPYDFKVLSLRVLFANSTISSFSSQVELLVGQLFDELSVVEGGFHGSNIVFDGTLQSGAYRFVSASTNRFAMTSHVLEEVTITRAAFLTETDLSTEGRTVARFVLDGSLTFRRLQPFDLFGFEPVGFSNLLVSMELDQDHPADRSFAFAAGEMALDAARSRARDGSLPRRFPLQLSAMRQSEQRTDPSGRSVVAMPPDLGFIPVETVLGPGALGPVWFGLELALSFGSPGALAPRLGFTGALLAAWAPDPTGANVAVGIRLPGSESGRKSLTIMGPLSLAIGRLDLQHDGDGFLLRLRDVALSFLGLRLPPGGHANAALFSDPDPTAPSTSLGWYAAYMKDEEAG